MKHRISSWRDYSRRFGNTHLSWCPSFQEELYFRCILCHCVLQMFLSSGVARSNAAAVLTIRRRGALWYLPSGIYRSVLSQFARHSIRTAITKHKKSQSRRKFKLELTIWPRALTISDSGEGVSLLACILHFRLKHGGPKKPPSSAGSFRKAFKRGRR